MKHYIYFKDGRAFYDGNRYQFESVNHNKPHFAYTWKEITTGDFPNEIIDFLMDIIEGHDFYRLTWYLSQVIGGKVYRPMIFLGPARTGKTLVINLLKEIFSPFLNEKQVSVFSRFKNANHNVFLKNRLFISECNQATDPKPYTINFNNIFPRGCLDERLADLKKEYPSFIYYIMFRYEDFADHLMGKI